MKRRNFLVNSVTAAVGTALFGRAAATQPCPPELIGTDTVPCNGTGGTGDTALSIASSGLGIGQFANFTPNTTQRQNDIQWMTRALHYDPTNREIQYIGKPASSQSTDWVHYLYREVTDTWVRKGVVASGNGHSWLNTMDPLTGDLYWNNGQGGDVIYKYDRRAESWRNISLNNEQIGALAYHPNLFGGGEPGIFIWEGDSFYCYKIRDGSMHNVGPNPGGISGKTGRCRNGTGDYVRNRDSVVCGAKGWETDSNRRPVIEVHAGAGNAKDALSEGAIVYRGEAPVVIYGAGGGTQHGKLIAHPTDSTRLLLLEGFGTERIWSSSDGGANWVLEGRRHLFSGMGGWVDHWTIGRISEYGVLVGMSSASDGGKTLLWKPDV